MKTLKAQVSFEFIALFIVVMVAFLFFLAIYSEFQSVTNQVIQRDKASAAAQTLADAINTILSSEGVSLNLELPHGYTISQGVRSVIAVDSLNFKGSAAILTDSLNITLPANATNITVRKSAGIIYITGN